MCIFGDLQNICPIYLPFKYNIFDKKFMFVIFYVLHFFFLKNFLFFKKTHLIRFEMLCDLCCIDFPLKQERFVLLYIGLSIVFNKRINVKIFKQDKVCAFSLNFLFKNATWLEREVWDFFGIFFFYNLNIRRILLDYSFKGFPFRKDFPISGFFELMYNMSKHFFSIKKLEKCQEFRNFIYENVWNLI